MFLNRLDASRYRNLETFLPGLEIFLKPYNLDILLEKLLFSDFIQLINSLRSNQGKSFIPLVIWIEKHLHSVKNMKNSWFTGTVDHKIVFNWVLKPKRLKNTGISKDGNDWWKTIDNTSIHRQVGAGVFSLSPSSLVRTRSRFFARTFRALARFRLITSAKV